MAPREYDFCGWATKNDVLCSDGRTIRRDAFANQDGMQVPLLWNHDHKEARNVLGHAILENRPEGVYAYCSFNDTPEGQRAKKLVSHRDIRQMSIWANGLRQTPTKDVMHGVIREVSLVLSGANPEAIIDCPYIEAKEVRHSADPDFVEEFDAEIYTGECFELYHSDEQETTDSLATEEEEPKAEEPEQKPVEPETTEPETTETADPADSAVQDTAKPDDEIQHSDEKKEEPKMADATEKTVGDVLDELTEEQQAAVYYLIDKTVEEALKSGEAAHSEEMEDGDIMHHNVFEGGQDEFLQHAEEFFKHSDEVFKDAKRYGNLKEAVLEHAATYGIENVDYLFPDPKNVYDEPEFKKRQTEWVSAFMDSAHKTPFARIKSIVADITEATARAKGYITGNQKVSEVFSLLRRTTDPTTVYKYQKLDRDVILDITDFDIIRFMKSEMKLMLSEEVARAALVGDGRDGAATDKINEQNIRPIWTDADLYTVKATVTVASNASDNDLAKALVAGIIRSRKNYKGSGNPTLFTTEDILNTMLLATDDVGRDLYDSVEKLAAKLRVSKIVTVEVMEGLYRTDNGTRKDLLGIIVNPRDYNFGSDKGGETSFFDDFNLEYNQNQFLLETRLSGALTKPYSAIAIEKVVNPI